MGKGYIKIVMSWIGEKLIHGKGLKKNIMGNGYNLKNRYVVGRGKVDLKNGNIRTFIFVRLTPFPNDISIYDLGIFKKTSAVILVGVGIGNAWRTRSFNF